MVLCTIVCMSADGFIMCTAACSLFKMIWGHFFCKYQAFFDVWKLDLERISVSLFTANYLFEACDSSLHENIANNVIATQWVFQRYPKCWNWNIFKGMFKKRACSHIWKTKNKQIWKYGIQRAWATPRRAKELLMSVWLIPLAVWLGKSPIYIF